MMEEKKPFYKKAWFLITVSAFILFVMIGSVLDDEETTDAETEETEKNPEETEDITEPETPEEKVESAVYGVFGEENIFHEEESSIDSINYNQDTGHVEIIVFSASNISNDHIKDNALYNMGDTLELLSDNEDISSVNFEILYPLQNEYGEQTDKPITTASFSEETLNKIVWENFSGTRIPDAADEYWYHPTLDE